MNILGIESSCDETAAAVYDGSELRSNIIYTQKIHGKYGGVVPELASREHLKNIIPVVYSALNQSSMTLDEIKGVAVTQGPGLAGSLLIGIAFAKAVAFSRNLPIVGVNHIEAHLWAPKLEYPDIECPFLGLIISGGHTQLWNVRGFGDYTLIGMTHDDAVGEAFDKAAQMLGLEYPGGPVIDRLSEKGDSKYHKFPKPSIKNRPYDFSFSGLKTSLLYYLESKSKTEIEDHKADIAASFQQALIDSLADKTFLAAKNTGVRNIVLGGGVAANRALKYLMKSKAKDENIRIYYPSPQFCTDNAAMIAYVGHILLEQNKVSDPGFSAKPSMKLAD